VFTLFNSESSTLATPSILISTNPSESVGGYSLGGSLGEGAGQWVLKSDLTEARSDLQAVACAGKVYLIGGLDSNGELSDTVVEYDPVFETQTAKASLPLGRYRFGAGCVDGKVIVAGGFQNATDPDAVPVATAESFDPTTNTWTSIASMATNRGDTTAIGVNGKLYVLFGYTTEYDLLSSVEEYDPASNTWQTKTPSPNTARGDVSCSLAPDMKSIVVAGGWGNGANDFYAFVHDAEMYDVTTDTWTAITSIPAARGDMSVVTHKGQVHVIGGEIWSGINVPCAWDPASPCGVNEIATHDHFILDMANNVWTRGAPMPSARFRFSSVDANGSIFVFGGHGDGKRVVSAVEAFYDVATEPLYYYIKDNMVVAEAARLR
jgi:N-acetylneuraminic acid mutarotase